MTLVTRLGDLFLTRDRKRRVRLAQAGLASMLMAVCVATMHLGVALGIVAAGPEITAWTIASIAGFVGVGIVIRSGVSARFADPSLTLFQMVYAIACAGWGYTLAGAAHTIAPMMLAVILMFGMFGMTTRQVLFVAAYALLVFGGVMTWMTRRDPVVFPPGSDLMLFIVLGVMIAGVVALSQQLHHMRDRLRERKDALEVAVARIERLATHDDLTGLVNRRHMQDLLEDERARHQRDRLPWCVALIDIDHFKRVNDQHGHACGDEVLRALSQRAMSLIRKTDSLGRWGGEEFVLLLPGAGLEAASGSVERVRHHFSDNPLKVGAITLPVSFSAGVTEHRSGESVAQTLERADQLAYKAKQAGRNRVEGG